MTRRAPVPAELAFDGNGTPYAPGYGDVYHSASGGLAQAREVFLAGNDLPARWHGRETFVILETGFGLGLNFLATWQAWREDPQHPRRLHYLSIEKHPLRREDLARALTHLSAPTPFADELVSAWPSLLPGPHRLHFDGDGVILTLVFDDVRAALPDLAASVDAIYLDGFSPAKNPEMWSPQAMSDLAWLAAEGATLATWSVAGEVRRALAAAGFEVEKKPGFAGKRERLVGHYRGKPTVAAAAKPHRVAIVGAGIAGLCCAERLAARGVEVTVFERREQPGLETSGNHQAVILPMLAVEETRLHRLHRSAFLYARRRYETLSGVFSPCGVFQIGRDADHQRRQQRIVAEQGWPADFVTYLDAAAGAERVGAEVAGPGWWFPQGGWLAPPLLIAALQATQPIALQVATNVAELEESENGWLLRDEAGKPLWQGEAVILANALDMRRLLSAAPLPLRAFRGQVTHLPASALAGIPQAVLCRDGYLAPAHAGIASLGATFQRSESRELCREDHVRNLVRLEQMLPGLSGRFLPETLSGRVGVRPVSPDKLPLVGAAPQAEAPAGLTAHVEWPRRPGLYVATGYGARGFVWAPLMGELLACQMLGEPLPVGHELAAAVDPARFVFRGFL